jgi:hypothetical protein
MQAFIGSKLLSSNVAQSTQKPFEIYDSRLSGFTLRVQPTGVRSYYARFGRNCQFALGKLGTLRWCCSGGYRSQANSYFFVVFPIDPYVMGCLTTVTAQCA